MKIIGEFKAFISRGNVMDLAVGVIIGTAFGKIITSVVDNLISPILGLILGRVDLSDLVVPLIQQGDKQVVLSYGAFMQSCLDFLITAVAVFFLIKALQTLHRVVKREEVPPPPAPPEPSSEEMLLREIRDLLKQGR
ncbi:MAG: large-conductance mechanosensitive channel protein MscL [Candidatus Methylacidiphilales bacterium]